MPMMRRGRTSVFDPQVSVKDRVKSRQDAHRTTIWPSASLPAPLTRGCDRAADHTRRDMLHDLAGQGGQFLTTWNWPTGLLLRPVSSWRLRNLKLPADLR